MSSPRIDALCPALKFIPSAWVGGESLAHFLCALTKPKVIVELGVDNGYSAVAWTVLSEATVYGVDRTVDRAQLYTAQLDLKRLVLIEDDFQALAKRWTDPVDILHIDGDHTLEAVTADFNSWKPHVKPGGLIVFHDTQSFPDTVGKFFNSRPEIRFEVQHFCGIGVLINET